jgi:2-dehydro-3-deoxyphosphogluconate aldolase / (4S)-4-hydroxy-2-oxoglutarate aldolase
MNREEVRNRIGEIGIVPCARVKTIEHAQFAAEMLYDAGIPVLEIPLTPLHDAPNAIGELAKRHADLVVGAGTVLDVESAQRAIDAGARFITSPGFTPDVVDCARKAEVAVFPGALTPSEVIAAWKAGADIVKIFPAATAGGTHYVQALKMPLPEIPLMVSGGVNQLTAFDYILAGALAIGVGSELLPKDALLHRQGRRIHELARRFLVMVKEARAQRAAG